MSWALTSHRSPFQFWQRNTASCANTQAWDFWGDTVFDLILIIMLVKWAIGPDFFVIANFAAVLTRHDRPLETSIWYDLLVYTHPSTDLRLYSRPSTAEAWRPHRQFTRKADWLYTYLVLKSATHTHNLIITVHWQRKLCLNVLPGVLLSPRRWQKDNLMISFSQVWQ